MPRLSSSILKLNLTLLLNFHCSNTSVLSKMIHYKCRNGVYPLSEVNRLQVADEQVPWSVSVLEYNPPEYNSESIQNKPWADPSFGEASFKPKWNELDGNVNRKSHENSYKIEKNRPLNIVGRTGLTGRGRLGRWGPNHAADPIVTRWKTLNGEKVLHDISKKAILQFCAIQRRDNGEWAIPGGMVDPGEQVSDTLKREFMEEAMNSLQTSKDQLLKDKDVVNKFFKKGEEIYKGYVDDPRNTDNAWMETVAVNFHDDNGDFLGKINLTAGDDAQNVRWKDIDKNLVLYASHADFIKKVAILRNAHW